MHLQSELTDLLPHLRLVRVVMVRIVIASLLLVVVFLVLSCQGLPVMRTHRIVPLMLQNHICIHTLTMYDQRIDHGHEACKGELAVSAAIG